MQVTKTVAAIVALSLTTVPAFAASSVNPAAGLTLANASSGGKSAKPKGTTVLLAGLGAAAVIGAAVALGSKHDSKPASS